MATASSKPLILLTDDDHSALAAYKRRLRRHFRLATASSAQDAIGIMQAELPDAVVSDLHMPEMNGVSLLTEVRRMAPKAVRILITGQPDVPHMVNAINTGEIFRLLVKPCASDDIVAAIDEGLGRHQPSDMTSGFSPAPSEAELALTAHASKRAQQRAIPPIVVEWLMRFGSQSWSRGASVYMFEKESRRRLRSHLGQRLFTSIEPWLDAYAVVGGGRKVVTVGWRQEKRRH
jgi:response regulator RpfG family c-di-GMP phosphodiesterase